MCRAASTACGPKRVASNQEYPADQVYYDVMDSYAKLIELEK